MLHPHTWIVHSLTSLLIVSTSRRLVVDYTPGYFFNQLLPNWPPQCPLDTKSSQEHRRLVNNFTWHFSDPWSLDQITGKKLGYKLPYTLSYSYRLSHPLPILSSLYTNNWKDTYSLFTLWLPVQYKSNVPTRSSWLLLPYLSYVILRYRHPNDRTLRPP